MSYNRMVRRLAAVSLLCLAATNGASAQQQQRRRDRDGSASGDGSAGVMTAGKHRSLGEVALSERRFDDAMSHYREAIKMEPGVAANHYKLYRVHNRMRRLSDALTDLTNALEIEPNGVDYRKQRALILVNLGQCDRAVEDYKELKRLGADDAKWKDAETEAVRCAAEVGAAMKAYMSEEWEAAVQYFGMALSHMESAADLTYMKARAEYKVEDYYGTISDTGRVLKSHPKHLDAYQLRGEAYFRLGEHDMAVKHFREALKLDPEHSGCKAGHKAVKNITKKEKRGDDAYGRGEKKEAINHWRQAMEADPTHLAFILPMRLKVSGALSEIGEHAEAIKEAVAHIVFQESVDGLIALADAELSAEQYEDAVLTLRKAVNFEVKITLHISAVPVR